MNDVAAAGKWRDLGLRAGVAVVLVPIVIYCIWHGGSAFLGLLVVIAGLMVFEWCRLVFAQKVVNVQYLIHGAAVFGVLLCLVSGLNIIAIAILLIGWAISVTLAKRSDGKSLPWALYGVPYIALPVCALYMLRADASYGLMATVWVFVLIWATDTGAYFAGRIIGGPKLAPKYSPKKTWAGLVGGAVMAAVASTLVAYYFNITSLAILALIAAVVAGLSQAGDIFESALKRHYGVKDSSGILPGHGGILDRVDGLVVVAVLCAAIGIMRAGIESPARGLMVW